MTTTTTFVARLGAAAAATTLAAIALTGCSGGGGQQYIDSYDTAAARITISGDKVDVLWIDCSNPAKPQRDTSQGSLDSSKTTLVFSGAPYDGTTATVVTDDAFVINDRSIPGVNTETGKPLNEKWSSALDGAGCPAK